MSKTLEYAYDDYCIAQIAKYVGNDSIYNEFMARSRNYVNQFNPSTGFMQPRRSDGSFVEPFAPDAYTEDICESNAWHYLWSVQHDVDSLISLLGGKERFEQRLDRFFTAEVDSAALPCSAPA